MYSTVLLTLATSASTLAIFFLFSFTINSANYLSMIAAQALTAIPFQKGKAEWAAERA